MPRFITLLTFFAFTLTPDLFAAIDLTALIKDSQKISTSNQRVTFAWWIPDQFWEESFRQEGALTEQQQTEFKKLLDPYTIFCVAALDIGPMGGIRGKNKELLLANTKLQIGKTIVAPVSDEELEPDVKNLFTIMKPLLANMMGQMGQGMEFIIYRKDKFVRKNLDPLKPGSFQYKVYDETFRWRLPLGSLLPGKIDPATKEEFPGDYNFNPFTGEKLQVKSQP